MAMDDTANPAGATAEWSLKAIPNTPKRLSILPGIIILTVLRQNLQTGATSIGLTAANRWDAAVLAFRGAPIDYVRAYFRTYMER